MTESERIEEAARSLAALERQVAGTEQVTAGFSAELARLSQSLTFTGREVSVLSVGIGRGLRGAFDGLVFDGLRLSEALTMVGRSMIDGVYATALKPVQRAAGTALAEGIAGVAGALFPFARGAGFAQGRVMPFAEGGVVSRPTPFAMRGGATGLMGEAGPEAILPLARGPDGRLGVAAGGTGRAVNVTMQVVTPDAPGFARSRGQIAAQLARALARGERNR